LKSKLKKRKIITVAIYVVMYIGLVYSQDCSEGYTYYNEIPETATILPGDSGEIDFCLSDIDRGVLMDIMTENNLLYLELGDINGDSGWNVLDIVALANCVLAGNCIDQENSCAGDMNGDGGYNVLDIVALANCVLADSCGSEYSCTDPINVGNQTWKDSRLTGLVASYTPNGSNGINTQLTSLPESIGDLSELAFLYLEWNLLTYLPNNFSQLTSLVSLTINNNWLTSLPDDFGNLNQLFFLDLGYNQLPSVPESFCQLGSLQYLYLFNNQLESVPDCICNLNIDWSGFDGGGYPYFGIGANHLCNNVPECIENCANFELTLDQFYYSIPLEAPQDCP
jgi:hypothetical protein